MCSKPAESLTKPYIEEKVASGLGTSASCGGGGTAKTTAADALEKTVEEGNTASAVIQLATVWFNFAAPPPTPITRKIDYTRCDTFPYNIF